MAEQAARRLIHYEIQALHGDRWLIDATVLNRSEALAEAHRLLERPDIQGVRVWKEVYHPATEQAAGYFLFKQVKANPDRPRQLRPRLSARTPSSASGPKPEPHRRRVGTVPPPTAATAWPFAALASFGVGTGALLVLIGLAAMG